MKYAIIIPDGCADEPQDSLRGQTPLQAAEIPAMNAIAEQGIVGRANNVPAHLPAGSDVATLSLLGYDPNTNFTGRAPLEAAAQGLKLEAQDWAVRCNLVTIHEQTMRDFTAGHISTEEAAELLCAAQSQLGGATLEFVPGVSYRNLLLYRGAKTLAPFTRETRTTPPHDLTDHSVADDFPRGPGSDVLNELMARSMAIFADHPVNQRRIEQGKTAGHEHLAVGIGTSSPTAIIPRTAWQIWKDDYCCRFAARIGCPDRMGTDRSSWSDWLHRHRLRGQRALRGASHSNDRCYLCAHRSDR